MWMGLQVSTDLNFSAVVMEQTLNALAENDHCQGPGDRITQQNPLLLSIYLPGRVVTRRAYSNSTLLQR